jgi:hypothetical protein
LGLIEPDGLYTDQVAYKLFGNSLDRTPWRVDDILKNGHRGADDKTKLGWRLASQSYYAEQAGLITAAALSAETEDVAYRFDLATAASDEARHADAFLRYANFVGGSPDNCAAEIYLLDEQLSALPYLGRVLAHTVLEGFAADEFLLLQQYFMDDCLGEIYHNVRRDENRHVAMGINYIRRSIRDRDILTQLLTHGNEWMQVCEQYADVTALSEMIANLINQSAMRLREWFLSRHRNRMSAMNLIFERR